MNGRLKILVSLVALAAAVGSGYMAFVRTTTNQTVREANEAIDAAVALSQVAVKKSATLIEITNDLNLTTGREAIVAASREASAESLLVYDQYLRAAKLMQAVVDGADTEIGKTYWRLKRDSLSKLAATSKALADGYAVWQDPTIADRKSAYDRISRFADAAEAAKAEADRLMAEASAYRDQHRGKF